MKLRNRLKIMSDYMTNHLLKNGFMAVLMILCFVLLSVAVLYYENVRYCRKSAQHALKYGVDQTMTIDFYSENGLELVPFLEEVCNSDIIYGIGSWNIGGNDFEWTEELRNIQKNHKIWDGSERNSSLLEVVGINSAALPMLNMELQKGTPFENLTHKENTVWLYLGAAFHSIETGTEYVLETSEGKEMKYVVAGIFKKSQEILRPSVTGVTNQMVTASYCFDYGVMMVDDSAVYSSAGCYVCEKGKEEEAEELIRELADKYGVVYEIEPLKEIFDRLDEENYEFIYIITRIAIILMVISVILINSQHVINYMNRRREYGILYAQGLGQGDLLFIILGETILLFGTVLLSSMLAMKGINHMFWDTETNEVAFLVAQKIIYTRIYPLQMVLSNINTVISTVFIYRVIKSKTPVELMRKEN